MEDLAAFSSVRVVSKYLEVGMYVVSVWAAKRLVEKKRIAESPKTAGFMGLFYCERQISSTGAICSLFLAIWDLIRLEDEYEPIQ